MPGYRLYFLSREGHVTRALELVCDTDEEATALAEEQRKGARAELWTGARVVAEFPKKQDA